MKSAILTLALMMTACVAPIETSTANAVQGMICDPDCDPGNFQYLVSQVVGEATGLGPQVPGSLQCWHYDGGYDPISGEDHPASDECSAIYQDPWGQRYIVDCSSSSGCDHRACDWLSDPTQYPCRY